MTRRANIFANKGTQVTLDIKFVDVDRDNLSVIEVTQNGKLINLNNTMTTETVQGRGLSIVNRESTIEPFVERQNNHYTDILNNADVLIQTNSDSDLQSVDLVNHDSI